MSARQEELQEGMFPRELVIRQILYLLSLISELTTFPTFVSLQSLLLIIFNLLFVLCGVEL